jgi:hypothetical protein
MEQLDGLAAELTEAGHLARVAAARSERPEPEFAMRLRAELLGELPTRRIDEDVSPADGLTAAAGLAASVPLPPDRPLDLPDRFAERRRGNRPFVGVDRRAWIVEADSGTLEPILFDPDGVDPTRAGKRWAQAHDRGTLSSGAVGSHDAEPVQSDREAADADRVAALRPSMHWRIPTRVLPLRWIAAGVAACLATASLVVSAGVFWPAQSVATASDSVSATLMRGDSQVALVTGMELHQGDEIKVAASGRATLDVDGGYVRMAGGSDVRLKSLDPSHVALDQIAGRVYYRVAVPAGGDYDVATATVTWKATGTAFDLDRGPTTGGGEQVTGLALYDGLDVTGPQIDATLAEGTSATIVLMPDGQPAGAPAIGPITTQMLADEWLIANAGLDARLGLPLGRLAAIVSPEPSASPTDEPTATPTAKPVPTATTTPTPTPTSKPAATKTPSPTVAAVEPPAPVSTPEPTPVPTHAPKPTGPVSLGGLNVTNNHGGSYSFSWPKYHGGDFSFYKLVYATYPQIPSYGTVGGYWDCDTTQADTGWTGTIAPGDYNVRLQAVNDSGPVILAQTNVVHVKVTELPPTQELGGLSAVANGNGTAWTFTWTAYTGGFSSYYKLVFENWDSGKDPSYPGSSYWAVPGTCQTSVVLNLGSTNGANATFAPGHYRVRIQAIGYPAGVYAYAETSVLELIVP